MLSRNQIKKARTVLQSLVHGLDPETGEDLPQKDTVNRIEVNRSMSVALTALEQVEARMLRRSQLPQSVGKAWTEEEEQQLKAEFAESEPIPLIATKHSRTVRAIEAPLSLQLLTRSQTHSCRVSTSGKWPRESTGRGYDPDRQSGTSDSYVRSG